MVTRIGAMPDRLQTIVDALSDRLQRSVVVDDPESALIASSRHYGDEDAMRIEALVQRRNPEAVISYLRQHGLLSWTEPVRVPGRLDLGFASRYCIPLRADDEMLGTAYLIDDASLTPDELEAIGSAAKEIVEVLRQRRAREEAQIFVHETALRDLIGSSAATAADAAEELLATGATARGRRYLIMVTSQGDLSKSVSSTEFVRSLRRQGRTVEAGSSLIVAGIENAVVTLVSSPHQDQAISAANRFLDNVENRISHLRSGISLGFSALAEAPSAFRQAMLAVEVATSLNTINRREFGSLGPYGALVGLPDDQDGELLSPLARRFEEVATDDLAATLERYLDEAGDVARTSSALLVHRSTIYYRLGRLEELLGVSLEDGLVRLELHIWLKRRALRTDSGLNTRSR
jgi:sugar diacid utilization regulator